MPRLKPPKTRLTKDEKSAWKAEKVNKKGKADHPALVSFGHVDDAKLPRAAQ